MKTMKRHRRSLRMLMAMLCKTDRFACYSFGFQTLLLAGSARIRQFPGPPHDNFNRPAGTHVDSALLDSRQEGSIGASASLINDSPMIHSVRDLHRRTINAISQALLIRAQIDPTMPLRFIDDGSMEPWEIAMTAGKIAQRHVKEWRQQQSPVDVEVDALVEETQVMAGRIVAVLTRLDDLEEELLNRLAGSSGSDDDFVELGVPMEELNARRRRSTVDGIAERRSNAASIIDAACLFDERLRANRSRSLLAAFLHEIEGPGLRKNNVTLPCSEVNFLTEKEWGMLFGSSAVGHGTRDSPLATNDDEGFDSCDEKDSSIRPALHPVTINAIAEAFRLRAQNSTTSPLRIIDSQTEWFDVQYSCIKFADRFLASTAKSTDSISLTPDELETVGGRIVGVLMRLDDLEWEWNHRICTSPLGRPDSPTRIPDNLWQSTLGLQPDNTEQLDFRTIDLELLRKPEFARTRAQRMLGLFLLNIEEPALNASRNKVPGGSTVDFIDDPRQLGLMKPRLAAE